VLTLYPSIHLLTIHSPQIALSQIAVFIEIVFMKNIIKCLLVTQFSFESSLYSFVLVEMFDVMFFLMNTANSH
jgi:hypothetical protein